MKLQKSVKYFFYLTNKFCGEKNRVRNRMTIRANVELSRKYIIYTDKKQRKKVCRELLAEKGNAEKLGRALSARSMNFK